MAVLLLLVVFVLLPVLMGVVACTCTAVDPRSEYYARKREEI